MKRWIFLIMGLLVVGAVAVPALAQSQQPTSNPAPMLGFGRGMRGLGAGPLVCSTSNPTDTVAQALGMSASDLRIALVSGQTVSQIAASKNVDMQTIRDALTAQRQADLDQALKDGLLTQEQYDTITQIMKNAPQADGNRQLAFRIPDHNIANPETAAAEALGMSCADLVKAERNGQSIAQIATGKGVEVQAVIDAVTKTYKDALAQDVKEGLITQAESDGQDSRLGAGISLWVNGVREGGRGNLFGGPGGFMPPNDFNGPMGGFGRRGGQDGFMGPNGFSGPQRGFGFGHRGGQGGMIPPNGFNGAPAAPTTPEATETPHV